MSDLSEVRFIERITPGSAHPEAVQQEEIMEKAAALLNRLSYLPRGEIIHIEKSFSLKNVGEHQEGCNAWTNLSPVTSHSRPCRITRACRRRRRPAAGPRLARRASGVRRGG